jgi:hypothetical protein
MTGAVVEVADFRGCRRGLAQRQMLQRSCSASPGDDALRAADVTEPVGVLVLLQSSRPKPRDPDGLTPGRRVVVTD